MKKVKFSSILWYGISKGINSLFQPLKPRKEGPEVANKVGNRGFLRIFISLSLLALLLWLVRGNLAEIWQRLKSVKVSFFILAFLLFICCAIFLAWRLKSVLVVQGEFFSIGSLFSLTLIGYFFTNFMPTSVGGDLVKGYYVSKKNKKRLAAYTSIFLDRAIGLFSVALIASITLVIMRKNIEHKFIIWVITFLLFSCVSFAFVIFQKKLLKRIGEAIGITRLLQTLKLELPAKKVYQALNIYIYHKKAIVKSIILSLAGQFVGFLSVFLLAKSLSVYLPLEKILLVMPVIFILCMLPITMNGLGLREWAFNFFFSPDIGNSAALSLSLLYLAMFLLTSLIGGIIYLFRFGGEKIGQ